MNTSRIERDARVLATDGEVGRVTHVVVDPNTREVTDLVVDHAGQERLVPIGEVATAEGGTVHLRGTRAELSRAGGFRRDDFDALAAQRADAETQGRALRGGAPLKDAEEDAVEIGGTETTVARDSRHASTPPVQPAKRSDEAQLELREEELLVRKQSVQTGQVELRTEVVAEQRTIDVPVTHEEVTIERHAVDRRPSDRPIRETSETISVPVREEQVLVEKQAVVYEEVQVGKRAVQETKQVSGTVRREEAVIEKEGTVDIEGDTGTPRTGRS